MSLFLKVEKPCQEPSENMQNISGGKFCSVCTKNVRDLSGLTGPEILDIIEQNRDQKFCGMFSSGQLDRPIIEYTMENSGVLPKKIHFPKLAAGLFITASLLSMYPAQGASPKATPTVHKKNSANKSSEKKTTEKLNDHILITGKVETDKTGKPLLTEVSFITTKKVYSSKTDATGNYTLEVPKGIINDENVLEFNPEDLSYQRELIVFTKEQLLAHSKIRLPESDYGKVMGEVSFGPPAATQQSLILLDGRKVDARLFNKSYSLFYSRYKIHYISKEFVKFFTEDKSIHDLYIVFVRQR